MRRAAIIFLAGLVVGPTWRARYEVTGWASAFR
jgi:hypothetical protein